jgi:hypothetical protein
MGIILGGTRERLGAVRDGLLSLHRELVRSERAVYERDIEKVTSSYHMLGLLMNDPWFAWLHDLSRLIAEIDEAMEERKAALTPADAERFIARAVRLVAPDEHGEGFGRRYFEALQRDPDVILAHRQFRRVLQAA